MRRRDGLHGGHREDAFAPWAVQYCIGVIIRHVYAAYLCNSETIPFLALSGERWERRYHPVSAMLGALLKQLALTAWEVEVVEGQTARVVGHH